MQSKARGSRLSRRVHLDVAKPCLERDPGEDRSPLHCLLMAPVLFLCVPSAGFLLENIAPNPVVDLCFDVPWNSHRQSSNGFHAGVDGVITYHLSGTVLDSVSYSVPSSHVLVLQMKK